MTNPRTYLIPLALFDEFVARFGRLTRRAEKLGVPAPSYEIVDERTVTVDEYRRVTCKVVTVEGEAPRYGGWAPIAVILRDLDEPDVPNLVHVLDGDVDLAWRDHDGGCDHCGTNRRRSRLVAVEHADEGRKVVGATCLRDFLGHESPEQIASWIEALGALDGSFDDLYLDEDDFDRLPGIPTEFDPEAFLAATFAVVDDIGWTPRSRAGEGSAATVDVVVPLMAKGKAEWSDDNAAEARRAIRWAQEIEIGPATGDYLLNVSAVAQKGSWGDRDFGIAASIASAYRRAVAETLTAAPAGESEHFGEVKERVTFTAVVSRVHRMPGYAYHSPDRAIVGFTTAEGDAAVWFASNAARAPKVGATVEVTGTVKEHGEFRGQKQTVVTRCKVNA